MIHSQNIPKKLIVLLLLVSTLLSLSACGKKKKSDMSTPAESASMASSAESSSASEITTESPDKAEEDASSEENEEEKLPKYKFAVVSNIKGDYKRKDDRNILTFALELTSDNWYVVDFGAKDKKTGKDIVNSDLLEWEPGGYGWNYYTGFICKDKNHKATQKEKMWYDTDRMTYLMRIKSYDKLNPDDVEITASFMDAKDTNSNSKIETVNINAKLKDLTSTQPFVHGQSIVKLGSDYYFVYGNSIGGKKDASYTSVQFKKVTGNIKDYSELKKIFTEKTVTLIDGNEDNKTYGKKIQLPKNCKYYIGYEDDKVFFGLQTKDGKEIASNDEAIAMAESVDLKVKTSSGDITFILHS